MRRLILAVITAAAVVLPAPAALAHDAGPCSGSGRDYAHHHIVFLARTGGLGDGGHKPGSHMGFSVCLGVHS